MAETKQLTGIKKRQQIADANKMIFVWVIIASIAVSLCGVTVQFLFRQAAFNQKIIGAKLETQSTLNQNLQNVEQLKKNVDGLLADDRLAKVKANESDTTLKVVLDALPTNDDKSALGASLQQVILPRSKLDIADLTTVSEGDLFTASNSAGTATTPDQTGTPTSSFAFSASGDYTKAQAMLGDVERTIRPINVKTMTLQGLDGSLRITVGGVTYYSPEQTVQLGKKTLKP